MKTFKRITAPKFRIGRFVLNEYELRSLILEVAKGNNPEYIGKQVNNSGHTAYITENGTLDNRLPGLHIASEFAVAHMEIKNKNKNF